MEKDSRNTIIQLLGIVRSKNALNQQDGECEDIVNLKLKNGAFRTAGKGRVLLTIDQQEANVKDYSSIFVHKVEYAHLLGIKQGKLYYFANILTGDIIEFLAQPQELCKASNDIFLQQTGHLITLIDKNNGDFLYFIFKNNAYTNIKLDNTATQDIYFNLITDEPQVYQNVETENNGDNFPKDNVLKNRLSTHNKVLECYNNTTKKNLFTRPFLICGAFKLYDGSMAYFTPIQMLYPYANVNLENLLKSTIKDFCNKRNLNIEDIDEKKSKIAYLIGAQYLGWIKDPDHQYDGKIIRLGSSEKQFLIAGYETGSKSYSIEELTSGEESTPALCSIGWKIISRKYFNKGITSWEVETESIGGETIEHSKKVTKINYSGILKNPYLGKVKTGISREGQPLHHVLKTASIQINIPQSLIDLMRDNSDIIQSFSLFVSPQIDLYYTEQAEAYSNDDDKKYKLGEFIHYTVDDDDDHYPQFFKYCAFAMKNRTNQEIITDIKNTQLYHLVDLSADELTAISQNQGKLTLNPDKYPELLYSIQQGQGFSLANYKHSITNNKNVPKVQFTYNGQIHIANYAEEKQRETVKSLMYGNYFHDTLSDITNGTRTWFNAQKLTAGTHNIPSMIVIIQDNGKTYTQTSYETLSVRDINRYIALKPITAEKITIYATQQPDPTQPMQIRYRKVQITLEKHTHINAAFHINSNFDFHNFSDIQSMSASEYESLYTNITNEQNINNGLKVAEHNNPMLFAEENTYKVGNGEILAICAISTNTNTGQTGNAPLLVFCTDGIYALTINERNEIAYSNATIIARDILNNPRSVMSIDQGVIFSTDRGLMFISETLHVTHLSEKPEGDVLNFMQDTQQAYKIMQAAFTKNKLANLDVKLQPSIDFLQFAKNAILNYNHNEKELWLSIPTRIANKFAYPYSYVLSNGIWTRRDFSALEYVNNFPTSYRKDIDGKLYKTDEQEGTTQNEITMGTSEANNKFFLLTRPIKLQTLKLKQAYRIIARGQFQTLNDSKIGLYIFGSYDAIKWGWIGGSERQGILSNIGCTVERTNVRYFKILLCGQITGKSRFNYFEITSENKILNDKIR